MQRWRDRKWTNNFDLVRDYGADNTGIIDGSVLLQQAINDANSAGGGIVFVPAGVYKILSPVTPKQGVSIEGVPWSWTDAAAGVVNGSIFRGDGTADCFKYVPTTYSSQPANGQVQAGACWQFHINNIAFDNFSCAIRAGSLYNTGFFQSTFRNILVTNATEWGLYFDNCSQSLWEHIMVRVSSTGAIGDIFFGAGHTNFTHGNSVLRWIYARAEQPQQRGIVLQSRAGSALNHIEVDHIQASSYGLNVYSSQIASITNGSATVTVTDGTKFKVDQPVGFTTAPGGAYGASPYQICFVTSVNGNNLTLSVKQRGADITNGTNGDYTIRNFGFPCIEVSGLETNYDPDGTVSSRIQSITLKDVDIENAAGCQILLQNGISKVEISTTTDPFTSQNVQYLQNLCARGMKGQWNCVEAINVDIDSGTSPFFCNGGYIQSWVNKSPLGIYYDTQLAQMVINVSDSNVGARRTLTEQKVSGLLFTYPGNGMGQRQWYSSGTSLTLNAVHSGMILFSGSSAGTWALPALVSGQGGLATNSTAGMGFEIVNDSSGAGSNLIINTNGTNKIGFRSSTYTQVTLTQGQSIHLRACWVASSSVFWAIVSNNGGVLA